MEPIIHEVKWSSNRKFGIELEFTAPSNRQLCHIIQAETSEPSHYSGWTHNVDNNEWCCKTDSTCGYEVASKVLKGISGFKSMTSVIDALKKNECEQPEKERNADPA